MGQELSNLATTLAIAEILAQGRSELELAKLQSFFASIAANISLILQTRNMEKAASGQSNPEEELAAEEAADD
ncbi:MAG: hypothetical protein FWE19_06515 [Oscillospiraceae bacterium]|nr:hypothetical protein [Oscillospiraceae bacterium]